MGSILFTICYDVYMVYGWLIFAHILLSWVPSVQSHPIGQLIERLVEPYLGIFRKFIPSIGMIDISPIVAIFVYHTLAKFALIGLQNIFAMM